MSEPASTTFVLQDLLNRLAAGDETARDELVKHALDRLLVIARKLLRSFGGEARVEMWTADVLGDACPRLLRALDEVKPTSPAQFFGLARLQMQRALLDRVRVIDGSGDQEKPRMTPISQFPANEQGARAALEPSGPDAVLQGDLLRDLVEAIGGLPEKQAETTWYKLAGYTHREIAEFLGVHHDTVDDYWSKACVKLAKKLAPFMQSR